MNWKWKILWLISFFFHYWYSIVDMAFKVTFELWNNQSVHITLQFFTGEILNFCFYYLDIWLQNTVTGSLQILPWRKKDICILQQERPGCTSWVLAWGGQCLLKPSLGRTCKDSGPRSMRARATHPITTSPLRSEKNKKKTPALQNYMWKTFFQDLSFYSFLFFCLHYNFFYFFFMLVLWHFELKNN